MSRKRKRNVTTVLAQLMEDSNAATFAPSFVQDRSWLSEEAWARKWLPAGVTDTIARGQIEEKRVPSCIRGWWWVGLGKWDGEARK